MLLENSKSPITEMRWIHKSYLKPYYGIDLSSSFRFMLKYSFILPIMTNYSDKSFACPKVTPRLHAVYKFYFFTSDEF